MAKLTKRDIVVAISNQTGMVQHEVFDVVQRTLDKTTGRAKPEPARKQLCNSVPCDCEIQSWQDHASASRAAFTGIKGSIRADRPAEKHGDAGPQRRITPDPKSAKLTLRWLARARADSGSPLPAAQN